MVTSVVPHDPNWKRAFDEEAYALKAALNPLEITLHHIGSTAIEGILAKPIIDLLGVVQNFISLDAATQAMTELGYNVMGEYGIESRRYFRKINEQGLRTHHLHVYQQGSPHIVRHIAFRDYLCAHPDIARDYSRLKAQLTEEPKKEAGAEGQSLAWENYLDGKDPFIQRVQGQAIAWAKRQKDQ